MVRGSLARVLFFAYCAARLGDPASAQQQEASFVSRLVDAREYLEDERFTTADSLLAGLRASAEFATAEPGWRASVYEMSARTALVLGEERQARDMMRALAAQPGSDPFEFARLVELSYQNAATLAAAESLTLFAERWPEALQRISVDVIAGILGSHGTESRESESWTDLIAALENSNFSDINLEFASGYWAAVALAALRADPALAEFAVSMVPSVMTLIAMQVDGRFTAMAARHPELFDVERAIRREIALLTQQATDNPRLLAPRVRLAAALRRGNRLGEALSMVNLTIDRLLAPSGDLGNWDDVAARTGPLLAEKAAILWAQGRRQESIDQLEQARLMPEMNRPNVSQAFALAQAYARLGMVEEARSLIDELRARSAEVAEVAGIVDLMIAVHSDDAPAMAAALTELDSARAGSRAIDVFALLLAGRLDSAADSYVSWLQEPESRFSALLLVQDFIDDSDRVGPAVIDQLLLDRRRELRARRDVRAAIDAFGRIGSFPIRRE